MPSAQSAPKKGFPRWAWFAIGGGTIIIALVIVLVMVVGGGQSTSQSGLTEDQFQNFATTTFPDAAGTSPLEVTSNAGTDNGLFSNNACSALKDQTGEVIATAHNDPYSSFLFDTVESAQIYYDNYFDCNKETLSYGDDLTNQFGDSSGASTGIMTIVQGFETDFCYAVYGNVSLTATSADVPACEDIQSWNDFVASSFVTAVNDA
jgi:hypothetical protein